MSRIILEKAQAYFIFRFVWSPHNPPFPMGVPSATKDAAFNRRFDPSHASLKRAVEAGEIGNLEQLTITSRDPAPPPLDYLPKSGGLFRDVMIHDFDMARWLLGEEWVSIYSRGSCLVDPQIGKLGDIETACVALATAVERQPVRRFGWGRPLNSKPTAK